MTDATTVTPDLATLGASGWTVNASPSVKANSRNAEPILTLGQITALLSTVLAQERNRGLANAFGAFHPETLAVPFNPHASAPVGTLTAGTVGTTEIVVNPSAFLVYGILWYGDTAAGSILLYDKSATGGNGVPHNVVYNAAQQFTGPLGFKFNNGCTAVGTATGVGGLILGRPQ